MRPGYACSYDFLLSQEMKAGKAGCYPATELCVVLGAVVMVGRVVKIKQISEDAKSTRCANGLIYSDLTSQLPFRVAPLHRGFDTSATLIRQTFLQIRVQDQ